MSWDIETLGTVSQRIAEDKLTKRLSIANPFLRVIVPPWLGWNGSEFIFKKLVAILNLFATVAHSRRPEFKANSVLSCGQSQFF